MIPIRSDVSVLFRVKVNFLAPGCTTLISFDGYPTHPPILEDESMPSSKIRFQPFENCPLSICTIRAPKIFPPPMAEFGEESAITDQVGTGTGVVLTVPF